MLPSVTRSIRRKVMLVVLITTFSGLLVAAAALLYYEAQNYRDLRVTDLATQADLLAGNSGPALVFDDPASAAANLALLKSRRGILAAGIYRSDGTLFASYTQPDALESLPPLPQWKGYRIGQGRLALIKPIVEHGETLGAVYLVTRYELWDRLRAYLLILATVMLAAFFVAALVSRWLQSAVTRPILALTDVSRRVVEQRDFSLRVPKTSHDEVGILVDAFNSMVTEVGERAEALRDANQRKDEFLATLAHELRNPLAPLTNALAILRSDRASPESTLLAREMMERQVAQLVRLVDDLLDVARITTGKLTVRQTPADLSEILRSAIETARPLLDSRKHNFQADLPADALFVNADATRLAQVFSNLLNNSAKYTDPGGHISLSVHQSGSEVLVEFADDGIGISPEALPRIFDMFTQADTSIERTHSGLGVGLTLARRLIELHGGTISARSAGLGKGSRFIVRLPMLPSQEKNASAVKSIAHQSDTSPLHILLVDDNVDFVASLQILLQSRGHEVRVAHEGYRALDIAREFVPDFAFLDIGLPELNGYELVRRLREMPALARTTFVAASGWGQEKDRELARQAGFALHLVKPVEFDQVLAIIDGHGVDGRVGTERRPQ